MEGKKEAVVVMNIFTSVYDSFCQKRLIEHSLEIRFLFSQYKLFISLFISSSGHRSFCSPWLMKT